MELILVKTGTDGPSVSRRDQKKGRISVHRARRLQSEPATEQRVQAVAGGFYTDT